MDKYNLEDLTQIFLLHSLQYDRWKKENKEKYPDVESCIDEFNISRALHLICCEIDLLKNDGRRERCLKNCKD